RKWTLEALAEFWTAVILQAPPSLTQALEEAAAGTGAGWPVVQASPEAFFERCHSLHWRFFAKLYEAFVAHVLPEARPCYARPLSGPAVACLAPALSGRVGGGWIAPGRCGPSPQAAARCTGVCVARLSYRFL